MDADAPIGVFDSGVGGLSVLRAIHAAMPAERLVYAADSAHAPYGDRDADFVVERSVRMVDALVERGVKALVIACNTASVLAAARLRARHAIPIVAMEPAIKPAVALSRSRVVAVLATKRTLASASVRRLCATHGLATRILLQPCPGLVERVEAGDLRGAATRTLLDRHVAPMLRAGADVVVLGCTHYPFLVPSLREIAGPGIAIVDSSRAVASELARRIARCGDDGTMRTDRTPRFLSTSPTAAVVAVFSSLWGVPVDVGPL